MLLQILLSPSNSLFTANIEDLTLLVFKVMFILAAFLYVLFSIVVVRQISIMRSTLITHVSSILTLLGYVHLLMSIIVLFLFIIIL